jgi:hypothetical protein
LSANTPIHLQQGGAEEVLESGAVQTVKSGARIALQGLLDVETPEWDDLRVPISAVHLGATLREPTWAKLVDNGAGSDGVYALDFSASQENEVLFVAQLPHSYREGTELKPHVHFTTKAGGSGNIKFDLEYSVASVNGIIPASTIITATFAASSEPALKHRYLSLPAITMTGQKISAMLFCRLRRDPNVASNFAAVVSMLEFDFHFQKDTFGGSRSESVK